MNIKEQIKNKLFNKTGKINSAILRQDWFLNSELYNNINLQISFTEKNISEKIYCILNDIKTPILCPTCNNKVKFGTFQTGYRKTCNNNICIRKNNTNWSSSSEAKKSNYKKTIDNFLQIYKNKSYTNCDVTNFINIRINETNSGRINQWVNKKIYNNYPNELCNIIDKTIILLPFSTVEKDFKWSERFYILKNNLHELPTCTICKQNKTEYVNFIKGYSVICSNNCFQQLSKNSRIKNKYEEIKNKSQEQGFEIKTPQINFTGVNNTIITLKCKKCGKIINKDLKNGRSKFIYCSGCYGDVGRSTYEDELLTFIKTLNLSTISNSKTLIPPQELDIYIPDKKIAIEFDGLYWHNDKHVDKNYHINKTNKCKQNGINLIHVFENEWMGKRPIVESIIKSKLGIYNNTIYARNCIIKEVDKDSKKAFLEDNHIQGNDNSRVYYGLYYKDDLVALMTFGNRLISKGKSEWELIRFCSKLNTQVVGGASRLLRHFERYNNPESLKTYADLRYCFSPDFYLKLGFDLKHISRPNYWYYNEYTLLHRVNFQKHKLADKLEIFDESLTEWQNMENNGYHRIFDCGNYVFHKKYIKNGG